MQASNIMLVFISTLMIRNYTYPSKQHRNSAEIGMLGYKAVCSNAAKFTLQPDGDSVKVLVKVLPVW